MSVLAAKPSAGRACPVCEAAGAFAGARCTFCGVFYRCPRCQYEFAPGEVGVAAPCPVCETRHDVPETHAPESLRPRSEPPGRASAALPSLADVLDAELGPLPGDPDVRAARLALARALLASGRPGAAAALLREAIPATGAADPEVLLEHARASLAAGETAAALESAARASAAGEQGVGLVAATALQVDADRAARVARVMESAQREGSPDTDGALAARVAHALALVAAGRGREAWRRVQALADQAGSRLPAVWSGLAAVTDPESPLRRSIPPRDLIWLARLALAAGDPVAAAAVAQDLADDEAADTPARADARELLAGLPGTSASDRAGHLLEAGRLHGISGGSDSLARSLELLEASVQLDPDLQEAYWYWADNTRSAGWTGPLPDRALAEQALEIWHRGAAVRPVEGAWPYLVVAAIHDALGAIGESDARDQAERAFVAAVDAVRENLRQDLDWYMPWVWLSRTARTIDLLSVAGFALATARASLPEETDDAMLRDESLSLLRVCAPARCLAELEPVPRKDRDDWHDDLELDCLMRLERLSEALELARSLLRRRKTLDSLIAYAYLAVRTREPDAARTVAEVDEWLGRDDGAAPGQWIGRAWIALAGHDLAGAERARRRADPTVDEPGSPDGYGDGQLGLALAVARHDRDAALAAVEGCRAGVTIGRAEELLGDLRWVAVEYDLPPDHAEDVRSRLLDLVGSAPDHLAGDIDEALLELDLAARGAGVDPDQLRALEVCTAVLLAAATPPAPAQEDWPLVLELQLGDALVPTDVDGNVDRWPLFADLIPELRTRLEADLGFPLVGLRVVRDLELPPNAFLVTVNGVPSTVGLVPEADEPAPMDQLPPSSWAPALEAVRSAVLADPAAVFAPLTIEMFLQDWEAEGHPARDVAAWIADSADNRFAAWQRLRREVAAHGRLPGWDDGLSNLLAELR